jgi:hypothetical protein
MGALRLRVLACEVLGIGTPRVLPCEIQGHNYRGWWKGRWKWRNHYLKKACLINYI